MTPRVQQIIGAMQGRQAAQVNDETLRDSVRATLERLMLDSKTRRQGAGFTAVVMSTCSAAAKTLIFEAEVPIALEMGASGELGEATGITQGNVSKWVAAYSVCGDRRAAQEYVSINSARDRKRADAVSREEQRQGYEQDGLRRAWEKFRAEGWTITCAMYAAALYTKIGRLSISRVLSREQIAEAKEEGKRTLRRDDPRRYRTMPDVELEQAPIFAAYWKAQLVRSFFETVQAQGRDIFDIETV